MDIALHDGDVTRFPNFAIMKLSSYHKMIGDNVEWFDPSKRYDKVYSSKVFTFTPEDAALPDNTIRGGTGYGVYEELDPEVDAVDPDYTIYPECDHAIGFLTRGCIRKCPWCIVPRKEGLIKPYRTWEQVARKDTNRIVFMDNNILACQYGIEQMESMVGRGYYIDFNQGMDARLVTPEIADIISKLKWIESIRFSCDTDQTLDTVLGVIEMLRARGVKPKRVFVYCLVTEDLVSAEKRCVALRDAGARPFAQPYRDYDNKIEPTIEQVRFANWVNNKYVFMQVRSFDEFDYRWRAKNAVKRKEELEASGLGKGSDRVVLCVETGVVYPDACAASEATGVRRKNIVACLNGFQKTAGKFHWQYIHSNKE